MTTVEEARADYVPGVRIDSVRVGERARKDYGDLEPLKASISEHGLLQPIVLLPDDYLLCGGRRLEACKQLGWDSIPFTRASNQGDALSRLRAERDENTCRKDMTPSELVTIGLKLEELRRPEAEAREYAGLRRGNEPGSPLGSIAPSGDSHATRREVADALGMSELAYARAKRVVKVSEDLDVDQAVRDVATQVRAEMDAGTMAISRAETKVREAFEERASQPKAPVDRPEHLRGTRHINADRVINTAVMDASNLVVPGLIRQVDFSDLDRDKLGEWVSSLSESIRALQALKRSLEKELNRG